MVTMRMSKSIAHNPIGIHDRPGSDPVCIFFPEVFRGLEGDGRDAGDLAVAVATAAGTATVSRVEAQQGLRRVTAEERHRAETSGRRGCNRRRSDGFWR